MRCDFEKKEETIENDEKSREKRVRDERMGKSGRHVWRKVERG
mgnify:CR=1 FL=1